MDEFEERLMNLFNEPIEKYVEKKRKKTTKKEEAEPEYKKEKIEKPSLIKPDPKIKVVRAYTNPFLSRR
jgi:hypothetical protein